ncbi:MAG: ABC transporter permease [Acholeplasmataceae bacterium]|jgi:ABC-type uncharacterized transport system permease subunit
MISFLLTQSFYFIIPLLVVAIAGMYSEKSGTVNIALEGIMVMGAFAGIFFISSVQFFFEPENLERIAELPERLQVFLKNSATFLNSKPHLLLTIAMVLSILSGMLFASLLGLLAINMKANQTIGGVALNILAGALAIFLARTLNNTEASQVKFTKEAFIFKSNFLIDLFPNLEPGTFIYRVVSGLNKVFFYDSYIFVYIAIIIFVATAFIIKKTRFGMRLSACGEHPHAAQSVGINVYRYRWAGILISGALGGLGGLIYIIPTSVSFSGSVAGYGFLALAVLIFGQWKPSGILFASIFFGIFKTLSVVYIGIPFIINWMEKNPNIPFGMIFNLMPYLITLIALAVTSKTSRAPKAAGIPFDAKGM